MNRFSKIRLENHRKSQPGIQIITSADRKRAAMQKLTVLLTAHLMQQNIFKMANTLEKHNTQKPPQLNFWLVVLKTLDSSRLFYIPNNRKIASIGMSTNKETLRYFGEVQEMKCLRLITSPNLLSRGSKREKQSPLEPNLKFRKLGSATVSQGGLSLSIVQQSRNLPKWINLDYKQDTLQPKSATVTNEKIEGKAKLNVSLKSTNSTIDGRRKQSSDYKDLEQKHNRLQDKITKLKEKFIRKGSQPAIKTHQSTKTPELNTQRLKTEPSFRTDEVEDLLQTPSTAIKNQEHLKYSYYVNELLNSTNSKTHGLVKQHLVHSIQVLAQIKNLEKPAIKYLEEKKVVLARHAHNRGKKTLVLDLDETLFHCGTSSLSSPTTVNMVLPSGKVSTVRINVRPFAREFLEKASKLFEVIIFTASNQTYADPVIDYLDPEKKLISHRLYRDSCWVTAEGRLVKDLRIFANRELGDLILVDNSPLCYAFQLDNAVPILPFFGSQEDQQLLELFQYLEQFVLVDDVRTLNSQYFQLDKYSLYTDPNRLVEELYQQK